MSRYYFHIKQGSHVLLDEEGLLLENIKAAYFEAQQSAMDLTRANIRAGMGLDASVVEIYDDKGHVLDAGPARFLLN